jgi:hypothetical protein
MVGATPQPYVRFEDFVAREQAGDTKHEWLDGVVCGTIASETGMDRARKYAGLPSIAGLGRGDRSAHGVAPPLHRIIDRSYWRS